jgi:AraC-like DNA-binding protein
MSVPASPAPGTISARVVVRLADFVAARGHDPEAFCRSVGTSVAVLRDPDARIPYALAERLGMRAAEITRDPNIGLHLAQDVRDPGRYDAGVLLLMSSPSLGASLERMQRHQRYWGDGERCRIVPVRGGIIVRYELPRATGEYLRHSDECAMAEIVLGARVLSGHDVVPRVVRFRHPRPADTREHDALFRSPLEFGAEHTELELADDVLELPLPNANAAFSAIFETQVERALSRLPAGSRTSADVRAAARAALAGGECTLPGTAKMLGTSVRTLQRRLREEGTSFGELVDALRREMALEYLGRDVAVQEIAWLLGYADASAFHHAFKRWTGTTPELARAGRHGSDAGD